MSEIVSGSITIFKQSTPPLGWTKLTTLNDYALRVVNGTISSVSATAFSTVFTTVTPTGSVTNPGVVGNFTLTSNEMAGHQHSHISTASFLTPGGNGPGPFSSVVGASPTGPWQLYSDAGGGGSHNHPLTLTGESFSGSTLDFNLKYVDVIVAQRD